MRYPPKSPEQVAAVRVLAAKGLLATEIAREIGEAPAWVRSISRRLAIPLRIASHEEVCRMGRASSPTRHQRLRVPRWVPAELVSEYRDFRAELGPVLAERAVRRLMAGDL